ncbi:MAG: hypothetical protein A2Y33_04015 [Spirochaetes bacterium GWF1_51_8]|nr:MAG: hypothetical protein A2Y33_04015 [Spirochaetes bacterium GWF1_51_8]
MRAVVLISGGLDSMLAVKLTEELGIEPVPVNFDMGFSQAKHRQKVPPKKPHPAGTQILRERGYDVHTIDVAEEYFYNVLLHPRHGYGSQVNPCIDCKIYFQKKAWEYGQTIGAEFIVTGEVLNQRPMSQRRNILFVIEKEAGLEGMVVRPLSGRILPATIPEKKGWIERSRMFDIEGRGRLRQMELAKNYGFAEFETPAGGCLLTEEHIAHRFFDRFRAEGKDNPDFKEYQLLKVGHHFRFSPSCTMVTGRNFYENKYIAEYAPLIRKDALLLDTQDIPGPLSILMGPDCGEHLEIALRITARYTDLKGNAMVKILDKQGNPLSERVSEGIEEWEYAKYRVLLDTAKKR